MSSIEFTPELLIFDLLGVHLYHGWLVSPDDCALRDAVQTFSYNQLVEFIISNSSDAHAAAPSPPSASAADAASSSPSSASASVSASDAVSASASGQSAGVSASPTPASDPTGSSGSSAADSTGAPDAREAGRAMLCHEFLNQTASQLTFAGINELQVRV